MNEERTLAKESNTSSPICESIDETHEMYNKNMMHVLKHLKGNDYMLIASHN